MGSLAEWYFRPRGWEQDGGLYARLGVVAFKRLLVRLTRRQPPGPAGPDSYSLPARSLAGVRAYERRARRNELVHLVALVPAVLGLVLGGLGGALTAVLVLVVALNLHPLLLQRYNRARLRRVLTRGEER